MSGNLMRIQRVVDTFTTTCLPGWRRIFCWFDNLLGPHEQTRNVICRLHSWAMRTARWDEL